MGKKKGKRPNKPRKPASVTDFSTYRSEKERTNDKEIERKRLASLFTGWRRPDNFERLVKRQESDRMVAEWNRFIHELNEGPGSDDAA